MKEKFIKFINIAMLAGLFLSACSNDDVDSTSRITVPELPNETSVSEDYWIYQNLVVPYNMEVKYRWDDSEADLTKNLIPPRLDYVVPLLSIIKKAWIEPYQKLSQKGGEEMHFMEKYIPRLFYLIGSVEYNSDGTVTEGSAESGRKIIINNVNAFTKDELIAKYDTLEDTHTFFHVMHHEFAHILNQKKNYDADFKNVTPSDYTAQWFNENFMKCRRLGYISKYSRENPDEDFAEMVAWMLTRTKEDFDKLIDDPRLPAEAQNKLRRKEEFVRKYFKEAYGIEIYELQAEIMKQVSEIISDDYDLFNVPGYTPSITNN